MEVSVANPQSVAPLSPSQVIEASASQPPGFAQRVMALPVQRKLMLGGGIAAIVAIFVAMMLWGREGDYRVLYTNLSDKDGGAILAQLQQMQVPYKHADGGAAILVPADKVHDVRLKLASAGLPKGSVVGFELMENQKFGTTQFQERLNFQRGLEGELVRSIQALSSVQSARVHLALPNQNGFFREQQKPSASVVLTLFSGRTLDRGQIAGIVHLVSSSVPEMSPKAVSIVDQTGALLSGPQEGVDHAGLDAQQLQYVRQIEANFAQRIRDILEPVVGKENLRAQVTAELDFSQTESTAEEYKPNQGADAQVTVRSQQTSEQSGSASATPAGVPGATTNQPPVPATAPINGAAAPLQAAQPNGSALTNGRREAVTNYEVDKTVRVTRSATGNIKRLNAAVVLNHRTITDAKGKTTTQPIPDEELEKLTSLVREAIGVDERRGDSIKVVNTPFQVVKEEPVDTPLWQQPEMDLIRTLAVPAALTLAALIVVFGAIRPAIKAAQPVPSEGAEQGKLSAVVDDVQELPALPGSGVALGPDGQALAALEPPGVDRRLESARALARGNPQAMAQVVRGWMNN